METETLTFSNVKINQTYKYLYIPIEQFLDYLKDFISKDIYEGKIVYNVLLKNAKKEYGPVDPWFEYFNGVSGTHNYIFRFFLPFWEIFFESGYQKQYYDYNTSFSLTNKNSDTILNARLKPLQNITLICDYKNYLLKKNDIYIFGFSIIDDKWFIEISYK